MSVKRKMSHDSPPQSSTLEQNLHENNYEREHLFDKSHRYVQKTRNVSVFFKWKYHGKTAIFTMHTVDGSVCTLICDDLNLILFSEEKKNKWMYESKRKSLFETHFLSIFFCNAWTLLLRIAVWRCLIVWKLLVPMRIFHDYSKSKRGKNKWSSTREKLIFYVILKCFFW